MTYALVAGVLFGLYFSLVGIGLNLVFGVMRIVNLAHGDMLMLGAFVAVGVVGIFGVDPLFAVPLAFVVFVLAGLLFYLAGAPTRRHKVQLPIEAGARDRERSLPEPDLAVLREIKPDYDTRHPRGDELLLVIEVSDTTAAFDLSRKVALYASAGVPEYWVLDLSRRVLVVHRQPSGSACRLVELLAEGDTVALENRAETVPVNSLFPRR